MPESFQDSLQPLSDRERKLLERLMSHPDQIPQTFWSAVKKKIEADPPSLLAADIQGLQNQFLVYSYTPSWTSASNPQPSLGNGTLVGAYMQIGRLVVFALELVAGSTTTFGTGQWFFTLPLPPGYVGSYGLTQNAVRGIAYDSSSGNVVLVAGDAPSANQYVNVYYGAAIPGALTVLAPAAPWTWATGDLVRINGHYFAA